MKCDTATAEHIQEAYGKKLGGSFETLYAVSAEVTTKKPKKKRNARYRVF